MALSPGHWRALLSLAVALIGLGREDAAGKALRRSLKASGASYINLLLDLQPGREDAAGKALRRSLKASGASYICLNLALEPGPRGRRPQGAAPLAQGIRCVLHKSKPRPRAWPRGRGRQGAAPLAQGIRCVLHKSKPSPRAWAARTPPARRCAARSRHPVRPT